MKKDGLFFKILLRHKNLILSSIDVAQLYLFYRRDEKICP